ncbi:MAG TPA: primosomal protein N' [Candidatus Baltobacteraceae bacterium]|jgi:primosomal protein N' (replication factor Y)|nr:primosomal protein N' [Candidatus Baltobacteraceae bacterium]
MISLLYCASLPFAKPVIARVTLEMALGKEFDYLIPAELNGDVEVGTRVKVPFANRQVLGCVTALIETSPHAGLRAIIKTIGRQSHVTPKILELSRWMAEYYCCPPEIALKTVLPEAVRREKEGWREQLFVRALPSHEADPKLTVRQAEILAAVRARKELPLQELLRQTHSTTQTLRRLEDKGLLHIAPQISERDPYARDTILPTQALSLNDAQKHSVEEIARALSPAGDGAGKSKPVFLLHGVTGSGKTEVYLQAIAGALQSGKGAIVLVPEISLTPQTVERFKARFSSGPLQTLVAVLHSHLSTGERHDEWHKIRQGRARIVIGARSAVFAPVHPLGLIIVDEEHEYSYKQEEAPRYHARDVAVVRGRMEDAVVVLGSATPSMESFFNVQKGKYRLLELPLRADDRKMPIVRIIDMRQAARREKGPPMFSLELKEAILKRLDRKEQTLLFLNRRGFATSLLCPLCGYVAQCPNCSLALTYHRQAGKLRCHICGHNADAPSVCPNPKCRNPAIRFAGIGTEKVEAALGKLFPRARVTRMDSDTLKRKEDYRRILGDFRTGKIDILVGTQMIAKGLHFPNVTLVGIIHADLSLHMPDFRAGERTFQLLTQVSGRAGRGDVEGEVFVQAFTPFHPAIQYARRHDFTGFYEQEMEFRRQLKYPPSGRIALLLLKGRNEEKVSFSADHVKQEIQKSAGAPPDLTISGPAPAPLARAETYYRYQIMLRTRHIPKLSRVLTGMIKELKLPDDVTLSVDIDPVNLM